VLPESWESQMPPAYTEAINLLPSAEDATQVQRLLGADVCVHVWACVGFARSTPIKTGNHDNLHAFIMPFEFRTSFHNLNVRSIEMPPRFGKEDSKTVSMLASKDGLANKKALKR
jgi:hypothetical protein